MDSVAGEAAWAVALLQLGCSGTVPGEAKSSCLSDRMLIPAVADVVVLAFVVVVLVGVGFDALPMMVAAPGARLKSGFLRLAVCIQRANTLTPFAPASSSSESESELLLSESLLLLVLLSLPTLLASRTRGELCSLLLCRTASTVDTAVSLSEIVVVSVEGIAAGLVDAGGDGSGTGAGEGMADLLMACGMGRRTADFHMLGMR